MREYFSPDHGVNKKSVVILNPREPSPAMQLLLSSQFFLEKVGADSRRRPGNGVGLGLQSSACNRPEDRQPWPPAGYHLLMDCAMRRSMFAQVKYVKGTPLNADDLAKARDSTADAVFVMSGELGSPLLSEGFDMEAALAARSVKMTSPWTPVYCQVTCAAPVVRPCLRSV